MPNDDDVNTAPLDNAHNLFTQFTADADAPHPVIAQKAVHLARALQQRANELQTPAEKRQQAELDRMIHHPTDKATLMQLTDQAFRSRVSQRAVDQLIHILDVQGIPRFFSPLDRTLMKGFQSFGGFLPGVAAPLVKQRMHRETANVILPAEHEHLAEHLTARRDEGVRMNVNYLGEALLGEEDARARLKSYLQAIQRDAIEVISVKISTIDSQISPLARAHTVRRLCDRMELLYRAAAKARYTHADGSQTPKFVYLDMEEYRDMALTAEAFMQTLERPGLENVAAGIALQAYIPDSFAWQRRITEWARRRVEAGGQPVTIRIVKGANMEMERAEASIAGWPQAPYKRKIETDANYKRMVRYGLERENSAAVRLGIASHNLFELAYGLTLGLENDAISRVQFEMLEGMANHQRRALFELVRNMLLYAPACKKEDFIHAIGYLIRRLDENTGPDNFLRHAFKLEVGSEDWVQLESQFLESFELMDEVSDEPRRKQDRRQESESAGGDVSDPSPLRGRLGGGDEPSGDDSQSDSQSSVVASGDLSRSESQNNAHSESPSPSPSLKGGGAEAHRFAASFTNEPDTDFSLPHNGEWAKALVKDGLKRTGDAPIELPLRIGDREVADERETIDSLDPSRPGVIVARWKAATIDDVNTAVACAKNDADNWRSTAAHGRRDVLFRVAAELRAARAELIGIAMVDGGKTIGESDPEVSEAIDFCAFYGLTACDFATLDGIKAQPRGVVVVVSPWNFPIAIPTGGVAAALAAGNTVILKPAPDTTATAYALCECFWRAGVSRNTLQLVPGFGKTTSAALVNHKDIDAVVFTGGTDTALTILDANPTLHLLAETGGKNATIVTSLADRDQAIKNVIHSAFGHSGQKCSATSLLILEEEVYEDARFRETLIDAVQSMHVGPAHELHTRVGPLIRPPKDHLEHGLKELEAGEEWALLPQQDEDNPCLWSPGVKYGVQPGGYTHTTEFFGPVLGVMRAKNLDEAIEFVNATGYGLTSGLESLDDREQALWRDAVRAGNLYVNRGTTGAIVLRQPFGGMGKSAFGPGIKAGGPNYVAPLMRFEETAIATGNAVGNGAVSGEAVGQASGLSREGSAAALEEKQEKQEKTGETPVPPEPPRSAPSPLHTGSSPSEPAPAHIEHVRDFAERLAGAPPADVDAKQVHDVIIAIQSYLRYYHEEFGVEHDHFRLIGQDNIRRYLPMKELRVRVHPADTLFDTFARVAAARTVGCRVTVSFPPEAHTPAIDWLDKLTTPWAGAIEFVEETDEKLVKVIARHQTDRVRYAAGNRAPLAVRRAAPPALIHIADAPVLRHGRIELLWYVQEQSVCDNYHRYGNLGLRAGEERAEPA